MMPGWSNIWTKYNNNKSNMSNQINIPTMTIPERRNWSPIQSRLPWRTGLLSRRFLLRKRNSFPERKVQRVKRVKGLKGESKMVFRFSVFRLPDHCRGLKGEMVKWWRANGFRLPDFNCFPTSGLLTSGLYFISPLINLHWLPPRSYSGSLILPRQQDSTISPVDTRPPQPGGGR